MSVRWFSRALALVGLLMFIYSLAYPWVIFRSFNMTVKYVPFEPISRLATGSTDLMGELMELIDAAGGENLYLELAIHMVFLALTLMLCILSPVGSSSGGYVAAVVLAAISLLSLLVFAQDLSKELSAAGWSFEYRLGDGAYLLLISLFFYASGAIAARRG